MKSLTRFRIVLVCMLAVLAAGSHQASAADGSKCSGPAVEGPLTASRSQEPRVSRKGRIQDLGEYQVALLWDNRAQIQVRSPEFEFRKSTGENGELEIVLSGTRSGDALSIRLGEDGVTVSSGNESVVVKRDEAGASFPDASEEMRKMLGGRAIAAFRQKVGQYERRLLREEATRQQPLFRKERNDEPVGYSLLLSAALLGELAGDPSALARTKELIIRRITNRLQVLRAAFEIRDCVTEYERYLLEVDNELEQCLDAADGRDTWYARAADRLGCHVEFIARAESGLLQFLSCSTFRLM